MLSKPERESSESHGGYLPLCALVLTKSRKTLSADALVHFMQGGSGLKFRSMEIPSVFPTLFP